MPKLICYINAFSKQPQPEVIKQVMKTKKVITFFFLFLLPALSLNAYWVWSPDEGKFISPEEGGQGAPQEQFEYAMQLYRERKLDKAQEQLEDLLKRHRGSQIAPEAQYFLGVIYEESDNYLKAYEAYKVVLESYPQSERIDEVIEREFRIGNLFLSGRKAKFMGLEVLPSLSKAEEIFQHIIRHAPYSEYGDQAQFRLGLTRKKAGHFEEAIEAFQAVIDSYPQSDLVSEARFQLADAAFLRSGVATRDQRALDQASDYVGHFLERYPDSTASEKAAKLRQEIDEKNSEKNYRVAHYYEKTNYLDSAMIYYTDVANRYPHTKWGEKAQQKLKALKEPVAFIRGEASELEQEKKDLEETLKQLPAEESYKRETLERKVERLEQKQKSLEKSKTESLRSREADLRRRKSEWKEKAKKLNKKKALLETNSSEDFKRAMDRWESLLMDEKDQIAEEEKQLASWKESLGVKERPNFLEMLPFLGEDASEIETVREIEAKKLYRVSDEKKELLEEKELLYKQYGEVNASLNSLRAQKTGLDAEKQDLKAIETSGDESFNLRRNKIEALRAEMEELEKRFKEKDKVYQERFGKSLWASWMAAPAALVTKPVGALGHSLKAISPFGRGDDLEDKPIEELLELRMHLKEKAAAQQNLVDTLSQAFDQELAMQEQKRLLASLENNEEMDVRELRKSIKSVEKEIRRAYEEIQDRDERKKERVKALEDLLRQREEEAAAPVRIGRAFLTPAKVLAKGTHSFIFGRKPKDVEATESADKIEGEGPKSLEIAKMKEEIEWESLMIEVRNREIIKLRKELEILKAKSSLDGGFKFRSSLVKVPYAFLEDAIDGAKRLIPTKDREEMLIQRLNEESGALEGLKRELTAVENEINERSESPGGGPSETAAPESGDAVQETGEEGLEDGEEMLLQQEIERLSAELEAKRREWERENSILDREVTAFRRESDQAHQKRDWKKEDKGLTSREKQLFKELDQIEKELGELIKQEERLEREETSVLEKRIEKIEHLVKQVNSKAMAQDLLREKEKMEERISQIETRRNFLARELERFQVAENRTP